MTGRSQARVHAAGKLAVALLGLLFGLVAALDLGASPPPAPPPEAHPVNPHPDSSELPPPPARSLDNGGTLLFGASVVPRGALRLVVDAQAALLGLEQALPQASAPGAAALVPLRSAAEKLGGALSGMNAALRAGDPGFFPALRDGCRALVELRTVARWLAVPPAVGEPINQLTANLRALRLHFGAEAMRARQGIPLRSSEQAEQARLATAARTVQRQVAPPPKKPGAPPPPPPPAPATERVMVGGMLELIVIAPPSLAGYLESLLRADVVLGTLAGEAPFLTSSEPPLDSAAGDLAASADTNVLFTANLASGETWSYLRQDGDGSGGAAAMLEGAQGELDPFEGDPVQEPADAAGEPTAAGDAAPALTEGAPPGTTAGAATQAPQAPVDGQQPVNGPADPSAATPPTADAGESEAATAPVGAATPGDPAATAGERLAAQVGGTYENGKITVHGNPQPSAGAAGAADTAETGDGEGPILTEDIGVALGADATQGLGAPSGAGDAVGEPAGNDAGLDLSGIVPGEPTETALVAVTFLDEPPAPFCPLDPLAGLAGAVGPRCPATPPL